ncbi:hypothetical protein C1141_19845 [Vibrio agarivorans]|nr:hypothetical protein C1141_19845 [Vibrio agarivorans]
MATHEFPGNCPARYARIEISRRPDGRFNFGVGYGGPHSYSGFAPLDKWGCVADTYNDALTLAAQYIRDKAGSIDRRIGAWLGSLADPQQGVLI